MVDNFRNIESLLQFSSEDDFYHLQIIKRKKEHPELGSNSYVVKTYYIISPEHLYQKKEEIISLCNHHNARSCINLNRRSFEKIAFNLLKKVTDQIMNKDFKSCRKAYESVCGAHSNEPNKKWIIDIDRRYDVDEYARIANKLHDIQPIGPKALRMLPTKNGYHIITCPFNIMEAKAFLPDDIHKDNPTILYIP